MTFRWGGERRWWLAAAAVLTLLPIVALAPPSAAAPAAPAAPVAPGRSPAGVTVAGPSGVEGLVPITPVRVLETRPGFPGFAGRRAAGPREVVAVPVAAAVGVPADRVAGVALNVTVTGPAAAGYLTVFPGGAAPLASTVNFVAGQTVPNGVIVGVAADGTVSILNGSPGTADLVVDVTGWIPANAGFTPITPVRALETRLAEPGFTGVGALGPNESRVVDVAAVVPGASGGKVGGRTITAVTVNLTAVNPTLPGYLTLFPEGAGRPPTSSVNFVAGQIVPNSAVVGVGPTGKVVVFNPLGTTHVVLDVTGYLVEGRTFKGMAPQRLYDSRAEFGGSGPLGPQQRLDLAVDVLAGLPRGFVGSVALNFTVPRSTASGYLAGYPHSSPVPASSSLNFVAGGPPVANTVVLGVDEEGRISITNGSNGFTDVIVDLTGWFPQDSVGLIADARQTRRYSLGTDRLGVVGCLGAGYDSGPYLAKLSEITTFYEWLSGGRYSPQFLDAGGGPLPPAGWTFDSNTEPCEPAAWPAGLTGGVRIVPTTSGARGLAGPGYICQDVTCTQGTSFPDNARDAWFTANSLVSAGTVYFSVAAHEFGHMLDWPHSYTGLSPSSCREYDNPLDLMSREPTGGGTGCSGAKPPSSFATPQATIALNRYAAGWMDPMAVTVHGGGTATYTLAAKGGYGAGKGQEMVVLPTPDGPAFYTLEVRSKAAGWDPTLAVYEGQLLTEGVAVHRFDQRAAVGCGLAKFLGRCSGLGRRNHKPGTPDQYDQVIPSGTSGLVGGVGLTVTPTAEQGVYRVTVSGAAASYAPILDREVAAATVSVAVADAGDGRPSPCVAVEGPLPAVRCAAAARG